jgi:hypothetical protein
MRYRIVEKREVRKEDGVDRCLPVYYVQEGYKFLFWVFWEEYLVGYHDEANARNFADALKERDAFKSRIL